MCFPLFLTKRYWNQENVHTAHLVPRRLGESVVEYLVGKHAGLRLNKPDHCLLIHREVEKYFDDFSLVLIPVDKSEYPIKRWMLYCSNDTALNKDMASNTVRDYHRVELEFKNDARPASQFPYMAFSLAVMYNKHWRRKGWENHIAFSSKMDPFATPGKYQRQSMSLVFHRLCGGF